MLIASQTWTYLEIQRTLTKQLRREREKKGREILAASQLHW